MKAKKNLPVWIDVNGKRVATSIGAVHYIEDNKIREIKLTLVQKINSEFVPVEDSQYLQECANWIVKTLKENEKMRNADRQQRKVDKMKQLVIDYNSKALCAMVKNGKVVYYIEYCKDWRIVYTKTISHKEYVKLTQSI